MAFLGLTTAKSKRKERKRSRELQGDIERMQSAPGPDQNVLRDRARKIAGEMHQSANLGREMGRKRGEEFLSRNFTGFNPQQRQQYESQANRRINREVERQQRDLIGKQGRHGVYGGAAYAQKADLARLGNEARQDSQSDIRNLDTALALKKMASQFAIEEGEAANRLLDEQSALDSLNLEEEKRRQRMYENRFNRNFNRL